MESAGSMAYGDFREVVQQRAAFVVLMSQCQLHMLFIIIIFLFFLLKEGVGSQENFRPFRKAPGPGQQVTCLCANENTP